MVGLAFALESGQSKTLSWAKFILLPQEINIKYTTKNCDGYKNTETKQKIELSVNAPHVHLHLPNVSMFR